MSTVFQRLMHDTETARAELLAVPTLVRGVKGDIPLASYLAFLGEAYHHVSHTVPLLMSCGARLPPRQEWLREAMAHYIDEELGHQNWILADIEAAGGDPAAVRDGQPLPDTELMVAYAYHSIERINPVAMLGMVLVLEGTSIRLSLDAADAIRERLALPEAAFSYLSSHGALDVGHMAFYESLVNRLDDQHDRAAVVHAARMFYRLYAAIFRALPIDD